MCQMPASPLMLRRAASAGYTGVGAMASCLMLDAPKRVTG
jgi:hypothetical protein